MPSLLPAHEIQRPQTQRVRSQAAQASDLLAQACEIAAARNAVKQARVSFLMALTEYRRLLMVESRERLRVVVGEIAE